MSSRAHREARLARTCALRSKLANDFIDHAVGSLMAENGGRYSDLLIVVEHIMFSTMLIGVKTHYASPRVAADLLEIAVTNAMQRLSNEMKKGD